MFSPKSKAHNIIFKKRLDKPIWDFLCNQRNAHASITILILKYMQKYGNKDVRQTVLEQMFNGQIPTAVSNSTTSFNTSADMSYAPKKYKSSKTSSNIKEPFSGVARKRATSHSGSIGKSDESEVTHGTLNKADTINLRNQLFGK